MSVLPQVQADTAFLEVPQAVAAGQLPLYDAIRLLEERAALLRGDTTHISQLSVLAVRMAEALLPHSAGVFLSEEDQLRMWAEPQRSRETHPDLHLVFLVLSCIQLTTTDDRHKGAKQMTSAIDSLLPESTGTPLN